MVSRSCVLLRRRILYLVVLVIAAAIPFGTKHGIILHHYTVYSGTIPGE